MTTRRKTAERGALPAELTSFVIELTIVSNVAFGDYAKSILLEAFLEAPAGSLSSTVCPIGNWSTGPRVSQTRWAGLRSGLSR